MSEKPEALRLADWHESVRLVGVEEECWKAAAELRRLHAENERLNAIALQAQNAAIDLTKKNERLREALKLAFTSHGRMLMSDPPQDAWKFNRVDEVINAALRREETT